MALDETPVFKRQKYATPIREQSIIVTDEGFYPPKFSVFKGERVRFFVTSTTDNKQCFILKGQEFFLAAKKGEISEGVAYFDDTGVVEFYCPTHKEKGRITVLARPTTKKQVKRSIASERVRIWTPRDE